MASSHPPSIRRANNPARLRDGFVPSRARAQLRQSLTCQAASSEAISAAPILVSDSALAHLKRLKADKGDEELMLRIGVKSGGCSGMSYAMDFTSSGDVSTDDSVMEYEGFKLVCDPKSLLYLFGMKLDYSNELVGGGFKFQNPNADSTCGCGKSFGV